jgi:hypothetical protein
MPHIVLTSDGSAEDYFLGRRFSDNLTIEIRPDGDVHLVRTPDRLGTRPVSASYRLLRSCAHPCSAG